MPTQNANITLPLSDRNEAGRLLAGRLQAYANQSNVIVLALPRGGVPVGAEIAEALHCPLFALVVRKLGVPGHEELAMGAVTSGGRAMINHALTSRLHISAHDVALIVERELIELRRREHLYSRGYPMPDVRDKVIILTDDGVATGSSMLLAVQALRAQGAKNVIAAVPVAPAETVARLKDAANEVVCLAEPEPFVAVGSWYEDFHQLSDHEVCQVLDRMFERTPQRQSA